MSKLSNCLTMLQLLSTGQKYNVQELSGILEVSSRMVRVYKEDLEKAGIYVDTIRGPYGGYVLSHSRQLPVRGFSKYDVELLKMLIDNVSSNSDLKKEYENLFNKVKGVYKSSKQKTDAKISDDNNEKDKYNVLSKCIKERKKAKIVFLSLSGTCSERIIHPCNMFFYDNEWFVSAFCELRGEIRHFRLKRIKEYKLLDEKYK